MKNKKYMKKKIFENEAYITEKGIVDTLYFVTKTSTKEQRRKFDIGDIYINAAVCKKCGDYVRSKNRHDFRSCKCGAVTVDGGSWYCKRLGNKEDYINVIEDFVEFIN